MVKRQFPGPAGLLHSDKIGTTTDQDEADDNLHSELSTQAKTRESLLSKGPWTDLLDRLKILDKNDPNLSSRPIEEMDISWIHTIANRLPMCRKIPFVAAVLEDAPELPSQLGHKKTPCVKLTDGKDTITAAIHAEFVKKYVAHLIPGTALALRNACILRWKSKHGLILTITSKNVIFMVSSKENEVIKLSDYYPADIMTEYEQLRDLDKIKKSYERMEEESQDFTTECGNPPKKKQLYTTLNGSHQQGNYNNTRITNVPAVNDKDCLDSDDDELFSCFDMSIMEDSNSRNIKPQDTELCETRVEQSVKSSSTQKESGDSQSQKLEGLIELSLNSLPSAQGSSGLSEHSMISQDNKNPQSIQNDDSNEEMNDDDDQFFCDIENEIASLC